jgi:hypothetical protein
VQLATGVVDTGGALVEYLRGFSKKFETELLVPSGVWGKIIHEKNLKQKNSWHCPFNEWNLSEFILLAG